MTADARLRLAARTGDRAALLRERLRSQDSPCGECGGRGVPYVDGSPRGVPACPSCAGTGLTLRPRVELAAFAGCPDAREAIGVGGLLGTGEWELPIGGGAHLVASRDLSAFVAGLSRWGPSVLVRAACAAARVAYTDWLSGRGWWLEGRVAGDTQGGGLVHMSLRVQPEGAWREIQAPLLAIESAEAWLACPCEEHARAWADAAMAPAAAGCTWIAMPPRWQGSEDDQTWRVAEAARLAWEPAVRAAIQEALIGWALA